METNLRADLLQYADLFPEGHHLREIALRTVLELSKENPFGRNIETTQVHAFEVATRRGKRFYSIEDASAKLGLPIHTINFEVGQVLKKYGLKMI